MVTQKNLRDFLTMDHIDLTSPFVYSPGGGGVLRKFRILPTSCGSSPVLFPMVAFNWSHARLETRWSLDTRHFRTLVINDASRQSSMDLSPKPPLCVGMWKKEEVVRTGKCIAFFNFLLIEPSSLVAQDLFKQEELRW